MHRGQHSRRAREMSSLLLESHGTEVPGKPTPAIRHNSCTSLGGVVSVLMLDAISSMREAMTTLISAVGGANPWFTVSGTPWCEFFCCLQCLH
ncbi:uncharacterized protein LOC119185950 isoform X3 [Rhipicephalus microplus]|uniref:uncharacterized protein LOC119185950 isoform X3 n=1 Tax=Rhipicephalus microplus TaxID=6941 RepID=UPI003F6C6A62